MYFSCSEIGQNGLNLVEQNGHNAWIEDALPGGNQTYLLLQVTNISLTTLQSPHFYQDSVAVGNLIDELLCMNN